jgi:hypothetical protein
MIVDKETFVKLSQLVYIMICNWFYANEVEQNDRTIVSLYTCRGDH